MATYVTYKCTKCDKNKFNSAQIVAANYEAMVVRCEGCGHEEEMKRPRTRKKSLQYPYYNDSMARTVTSKEHEDHIAKTEGFTKIQDYQGMD